jgi:hypothetical protein
MFFNRISFFQISYVTLTQHDFLSSEIEKYKKLKSFEQYSPNRPFLDCTAQESITGVITSPYSILVRFFSALL